MFKEANKVDMMLTEQLYLSYLVTFIGGMQFQFAQKGNFNVYLQRMCFQ